MLPLLAALALLPGVREVEHQTFDSAGVAIHFTLQGEGDAPLLLLHGFAGNEQQIVRLLPGLLADHWVIGVDARGHGRSGKPHDPASYGLEMVEDLVRLLDHLGVEKTHVLGYSMGGLITLKRVTEHPERVLSAVAGGYGWAEFAPEGEDLMDQVAAALERGEGFGPLFAELAKSEGSPDGLSTVEKALLAANDPLALAAAARGFRHLALREDELRKNRVPVLALVGENDALRADVERLATAMAALEVVVVPKADHGSAGTHPKFIENAKRFLAQNAAEPAAQPDSR